MSDFKPSYRDERADSVLDEKIGEKSRPSTASTSTLSVSPDDASFLHDKIGPGTLSNSSSWSVETGTTAVSGHVHPGKFVPVKGMFGRTKLIDASYHGAISDAKADLEVSKVPSWLAKPMAHMKVRSLALTKSRVIEKIKETTRATDKEIAALKKDVRAAGGFDGRPADPTTRFVGQHIHEVAQATPTTAPKFGINNSIDPLVGPAREGDRPFIRKLGSRAASFRSDTRPVTADTEKSFEKSGHIVPEATNTRGVVSDKEFEILAQSSMVAQQRRGLGGEMDLMAKSAAAVKQNRGGVSQETVTKTAHLYDERAVRGRV